MYAWLFAIMGMIVSILKIEAGIFRPSPMLPPPLPPIVSILKIEAGIFRLSFFKLVLSPFCSLYHPPPPACTSFANPGDGKRKFRHNSMRCIGIHLLHAHPNSLQLTPTREILFCERYARPCDFFTACAVCNLISTAIKYPSAVYIIARCHALRRTPNAMEIPGTY